MGIHYLWIDSLCIIQDNLEDKQKQIASMVQVYAQSICTLAASMSANSEEGCYVKAHANTRDRNNNHRVDLNIGPRRIRFFQESPINWEYEWGKGPLCKRAWTLQERFLSARNVFFSEEMLLWECNTCKASSELPWMQMVDMEPPPTLLLNDPAEDKVKIGSLAMREHWFNVVEDYSRRAMTNGSDTLPALSGLANEAKQLHGAYHAGLFYMDMPSALLWRTAVQYDEANNKPRRPSFYRAPTWSWASIDGVISYESQQRSETQVPSGSRVGEIAFGDCGILDVITDAKVRAPIGGADRWRMATGEGADWWWRRLVRAPTGEGADWWWRRLVVVPTGGGADWWWCRLVVVPTGVADWCCRLVVLPIAGDYYRLVVAQDGSAFVPRECMRIHGLLTTNLFSLYTPNQESATFVEAWHRLTDSNGTTVAALYPDVMSELEGGQLISRLQVRKECYWSSICLPFDLYGRNWEVEEDEDFGELVMGLAVTADDDHPEAYRLGLIRWMKSSCFDHVPSREITIH